MCKIYCTIVDTDASGEAVGMWARTAPTACLAGRGVSVHGLSDGGIAIFEEQLIDEAMVFRTAVKLGEVMASTGEFFNADKSSGSLAGSSPCAA
jgi:hypothetical protein